MRYVFILLTVFCTACGTALPTVKPYKLDVQQGNVVTSKMLLQLRPGMTKSQVRFILGTPLVQDSFHGNRWDYVYQMREAGKLKEQRRVILDFEKELLKTVRGDVIASKGEQAKLDAAESNIGTRLVEPAAKVEEKGLLGKLKFWEKDAADSKAKAAAAAAKNEAPLAAEKTRPAKPSTVVVPLEVQPALESAAAATVTPDAAPQATIPKAPLETVPVVPAPVVPAPVVPAAVDSAAVAVGIITAPTQEKTSPQEKAPIYESSSGMRFERTLQFAVEEAEPAVSSKAPAPRVGNKTVPTPKDLPVENATGIFDRMLEKIGF